MIRRVLIVDDETSVRAAVGSGLVRRGLEVVAAGSDEEAVQVHHQHWDGKGHADGLVFIEDEAERGYPAGIAGETLAGPT